MKFKYNWNEEEKIATVVIYYANRAFEGKAKCHPDDMDYGGEKTGLELASLRANIKVFKYRCQELRQQLVGLNHLKSIYDFNKVINHDGPEVKILNTEIDVIQGELEITEQEIKETERAIKDYIDTKEILYQKLRKIKRREEAPFVLATPKMMDKIDKIQDFKM